MSKESQALAVKCVESVSVVLDASSSFPPLDGQVPVRDLFGEHDAHIRWARANSFHRRPSRHMTDNRPCRRLPLLLWIINAHGASDDL